MRPDLPCLQPTGIEYQWFYLSPSISSISGSSACNKPRYRHSAPESCVRRPEFSERFLAEANTGVWCAAWITWPAADQNRISGVLSLTLQRSGQLVFLDAFLGLMSRYNHWQQATGFKRCHTTYLHTDDYRALALPQPPRFDFYIDSGSSR